MIMQVHDEVVINTLNTEIESVKRIVKEAMESVAVLRVPLIAEVNSASNWLDAH
jgi:DNA polymerase-1